jgi:Tol biopolymer transport system component/DNA-binding winged helix-turn-helix (wHTH) protein
VILSGKEFLPMSGYQPKPTVASFGPFEADFQTQEIRKHGVRLRLPGQSFQILRMLLERPGELVSRDDLHKALWPSDTFVDFEHGVNAAVNRLREALGDSADCPSIIETLPRRGYRFIGTTNPPPRLPEIVPEVVPEVVPEIVPEIVPNVPSESEHGISEFPATGQTKVGTSNRTRWMKISALILVGVACAIAMMFSYRRIWRPMDPPALTPVPFTDYPGFENCPAFSPDGSQIVFSWSGDPAAGLKGADLYVKAIHSENLLRLTQHPSGLICANWSPDGTQIAFYRFSANRVAGLPASIDDDTGIYLVPALGGPERKLRSTQGGWGGVTWSADGKRLAYSDHTSPAAVHHPTDPNRIFVLSLDTLESRQIPHADECLAETIPRFSHSGDRLAYVCLLKTNDNEFGIYSMSLSRGSPKLVAKFTTGWGWLNGFAWTADDKRLIIARTHVGNDFELDEVVLADGTLRKLSFGQDSRDPVVSAKGDRIAYSLVTRHNNIWRKDLRQTEAPGAKLISSTYEQNAAQYSPDGKHIAFSSNRGGASEIWMSDADGTNLVRMSDSKSSNAGTPRWSPDSQKLAFDSRQSGHPEVYIVDILERLPRKLITNVSDAETPNWSHDGKWLYFEATSDQRIFRCPAGGGDAIALSPEPGSFPFESYDGETVFFVSPAYSGDLHMVTLKQAGTSLAVKGMPALNCNCQYTPVPGGIYFVPASSPKSIQYFDFASRQIRKVFELDKETGNGLSVSPDARWILYTQVGEENGDIMLVEHFR